MFHWKWVPEESLLKSAVNVLWSNNEYRPNINGDPNWRNFAPGQDFSPSIASSNPDTEFKLLEWKSYERMFEVFSPVDHRIRLRTFSFPGWNVYIDKKPVNIDTEQRIGAISFQVPSGQHEVKVKFEHTQIRKTATYISFGALIVFIYLLRYAKKETEKTNQAIIDSTNETQKLLEEIDKLNKKIDIYRKAFEKFYNLQSAIKKEDWAEFEKLLKKEI